MKVDIKSVLAETNIEASPKALFSDVFQRVGQSLELKEKWYFGLCYEYNKTKGLIWLDTSKKVLKKVPYAAKNLNFRIKYYPEDVASELLEEVTVQIFYLEVKNLILQGHIYCPPDIAVMLASYALQIELGDFKEKKFNRYVVNSNEVFPNRLSKSYDIETSIWLESLADMWQELKGLDPEDAMMEYLKLAQNLDMYGVTYFSIRNKKKTRLLLGITSLGINVYTKNDKLTPQLSFSWSEIKKVRYNGKKLMLKFLDKKTPTFICFTLNGRTSKQIFNLTQGNRALYRRRRTPDCPEIVALKEKAKIVKELRQKRKEKHELELSSQKEYIRREEGYQKHLKNLQQNLESTLQNIQKEIAAKLEETRKLQKEIEAAKKEEEEYRINRHKAEENKLREKAKLEEEQYLLSLVPESEIPLPKIHEIDSKLQKFLKSLRTKMENSLKDDIDACLDRLHWDNLREGRDKYRTLSDSKKITCTRRIEEFNRM